jgi:hypothetical protein
MHRAVNPLLHSKSLLQQVVCVVKALFVDQHASEDGHRRGSLGMVFPVPRFSNVKRLPVKLLGLTVVSALDLNLTQINQSIGHRRMAFAE